MTDAFVNVEAPDAGPDLATDLAEIPSVSAAHSVKGQYDAVALVDLDEDELLQRVVTGLIHDVEGVEGTTTLIVEE